MPGRPRILLLAGDSRTPDDLLRESAEVVSEPAFPPALDPAAFRAILLDLSTDEGRSQAFNLAQTSHVLDALTDGLAIVDLNLRVLWCNRTFEEWCGIPPRGRGFYEALGSPHILPAENAPFHTALRAEAISKRLAARENRVLELHITPQAEGRLLALCRDVTADVHHQQQLDALHKAGRELASLDAQSLAEMDPEARVELLKQNIRRCTRELLHYDIIDIRLLDRRSNRLESLMAEGMSVEARERRLIASPQDNGVTGYVAATGKSHLVRDTHDDPLYIEGAAGMRSSLTVPLLFEDQIVGTFNVESPQVNAFDEQDVQFLEILSREIAAALHTLELLTAEKRETTTHAIESISREVALPVDEILSAGAVVLDRYIGVEAEMTSKIKLILTQARLIKQSIAKVGEALTPPSPDPKEQQTLFKGTRVLVVDNDENVRRSAHNILGRWGCVVETARDAREALTLVKLSTYDAILADIRLPDMTGYDVYRQFRTAQPQARVVLMTEYGYDPSHSLVKARQDGLKHVLFKPFRVDQLRDALTGCCQTSASP